MHRTPSQTLTGTNLALARRYRVAIFAGAVFAVLFPVIAMFHGYRSPILWMLGPIDDLFADYFKFITSFPGGSDVPVRSLFGLIDFPIPLSRVNPYLGTEAFTQGGPTHLHTMPLMTLYCLLSLRAMAWIGGAGGFAVSYAVLFAYWIKVVIGWAESRQEALTWIVVAAISYPVLMVVARGNIYAGCTGVLLVHAMLLAQKRTAPMLVAVLLALAVNIRPNAVLFVLPMVLFYWPQVCRALLSFCLAGGGIFLGSLILAHYLYPDYTLFNLLGGLQVYYEGYVIGNAGLALGSSLYGAVKFFIGYRFALDLATLLPSIAILLAATWRWMSGSLRDSAMLFLVAAAYCLGSSVIADYHLLVFIIPLMVSTREHGGASATAWADRIAAISCCLMLISKNYLFRDGVSYQVVLNPLILLVASGLVLVCAWRVPARTSLPLAKAAA